TDLTWVSVTVLKALGLNVQPPACIRWILRTLWRKAMCFFSGVCVCVCVCVCVWVCLWVRVLSMSVCGCVCVCVLVGWGVVVREYVNISVFVSVRVCVSVSVCYM